MVSSQNCETISGYYKSYYGTSHLYHGFQRCMGFVPEGSCMSSLRPQEDIQLPSGTNPIHLETHGTNITCISHLSLLRVHYRSGSFSCAMVCSGSRRFGRVEPPQTYVKLHHSFLVLYYSLNRFDRVELPQTHDKLSYGRNFL